MARYIVGIDLGTTHTVVAYADLNDLRQAQLFEVEQLVAPGEVAARPVFPSVRYHPAPGELADRDIALPWAESGSAVLGELARELGSHVPGRLVTSAKSWLSHRSVDRTEAILPWGAHEDVSRISPLDASASYLAHVRAAWNFHFSNHPLQEQEIILTIPASFDEGARALTMEAARIAGLAGARLIEEPLAACYDWLARNDDRLGSLLAGIRLLLICDIGGGTTDFTLVRVEAQDSAPRLTRIAVGDHLMLGGDNMDLALAHIAESRIVASKARLGAAGLSQLVQQCRLAKERLLAPGAPERTTVTVVGSGSRLIAGARSTELTRSEVAQILVEGFFPHTAPDEKPQRVRGGIVEFGLPYVADPAVTRHIAAFLARYANAAREALGGDSSLPAPDAVLLNGGVFKSEILSQRLLEVLQDWAGKPVRRLENDSPDLAVARGAAGYGLSRRGRGVRIGAGSARSYFLILDPDPENPKSGICILSRGTEEGREVRLPDRVFSLRLGQPVRFHLVSSSRDTTFQTGDLAEIDRESFSPLPPIAAVLPKEEGVEEQPVNLAAILTELGALKISCIARDNPAKRWSLEFQLRGAGAAAQGITGKLHPRFGEAAEMINLIFGAKRQEINPRQVRNLRRDVESLLGERYQWDTPLLRELFSSVWEGVRHRRRSPDHERIWLNLAGFCLRPGYGFPLDDWRVRQLWSIYDQGIQYGREAQVWSEWWTLWRRVAGGLDRRAQEKIFVEISADLQPPAKQQARQKNVHRGYDHIVRLAGALERIHFEHKIEVGELLLERLKSPSESIQSWWAIGRLGARVPFYGTANNVVPRNTAAQWLERALKADWRATLPAAFAAALLARMSGDRERDLDEDLRRRVAERLRAAESTPTWILMVEQITELDEADEKQVFGESLPPGLRLIH
jgi:molecular chaperone DnaK (HSP70)